MEVLSRAPRLTTLILGALFCYAVAILFGLPGMFYIAAALVIAPIVSRYVAAYGLKTLSGERRVPARLWPDERVDFEIRLENEAPTPKCLLWVDEDLPEGLQTDADQPPDCVVPMLWSDPYVHRYPVTATHRGRYRLGPLKATALDTFGLFNAVREIGPADEVVVYPRIIPLKDHALFGGVLDGRVDQTQPLPDGTDFRSTREYRPGDDLRRVHWRSTARQDKPIVMDFEEPASQDLVVILDVGPHSNLGQGKDTTLETGVTLAASIIERELEQGNAVGLVLDGAETRYHELTTDRHERLTMMESLALAEPDGPRDFAATLNAMGDTLPRGAFLLLISPNLNQPVFGAVGELLRKRFNIAFAWLDPTGYPGLTSSWLDAADYEGGDAVYDDAVGRLMTLKQIGATPFRVRRGHVAESIAIAL